MAKMSLQHAHYGPLIKLFQQPLDFNEFMIYKSLNINNIQLLNIKL